MNSVIKGSSYILVNTPDMVIHNGTTQTIEKLVNPNSDYLKQLPKFLRNYDDVLNYLPNQSYIGNIHPEDLGKIELPWFDKNSEISDRFGKFGEIMPQDEFLLLIQICDAFDLVKLEENFVKQVKASFENHKLMDQNIKSKIKNGVDIKEIEDLINNHSAEGLFNNGNLVGCVKKAHDIDVNLTSHIILENLVAKASSVLSLLHLVENAKINKEEIDYVIDCSEEACGDMNQRGGGNFSKASAEIAGFVNSTGSDTRGFCAAPVHAIIIGASLVSSGAFNNVVVTAGGSTAKLGMNGKDHIKKNIPILEDVLGSFSVLISKNDGTSPEIDLNILGKHTVGTGSSPQAVISSLVSEPLDKVGLKITDIDKFSVEMQNPDVTKPAGAGDVPYSNYKMIGALAVKRGEIEKSDLNNFIEKHGMVGFAPTQGHIPSGIPYIGYALEDILNKKINNTMIIGKGSLFLGRMTNLFDGVSFVIKPNEKNKSGDEFVSEEKIRKMIAKSMKEFANTLIKE